ncbi:Tetratricopeptide TPR_4 [Winogradskyella psychrotolerans RS-3]|uniref:Tetratricopeptide TPR_4 n=1 Tax=Winogradskyella psychrotolerans RS-3 TaxID=641526 RepID=S7XD65_9FLAO|nr:Tetratricopeptide TPR_4 [Winogradskyella psychrotolerans]EPR73953.1 Tetratricopeptide TPR_4 [Winogradskyella psychrotolerans RS-3]
MKKKLRIKRLNHTVFFSTVLLKIIVFAVVFTCLSTKAFAHGDLTKQILKKTEEISKSPNNFELYYQRGLLYQQHVEYPKAMEDYLKSQALGNTDSVLQYRIAELNYLSEDYNNALNSITVYLDIIPTDVKAKKLEAQILFHLKSYQESLSAYQYVIEHMEDIRPEDILEFTDIILAENNENYAQAIETIEVGLGKLGSNTIALQLKKLEYLKESDDIEKALQQYDYFIVEYKRKEFWYYKKANYLVEQNRTEEANIALKQATIAIDQLDAKFKKMESIIELEDKIKHLENSLNN